MASPEWNGGSKTAQSFGTKGAAITPGNTDLDPIPKAVVMLATGDISVVPAGNTSNTALTFSACPVGFMPPFVVRRVTACTSSCASVDA